MKWTALFLCSISLYGLNLQEAETRAMQSSPAVQLGNLQAEQNAAQYAQAFLSWFPDITYGAMVAVLEKSQRISHLQRQRFLFSNQLTLTQPIFSSSLLGNLNLARIIKEGGEVGKEIATNVTLYQVRLHFLEFGLKTQKSALEKVKLAYLQHVYQDEQAKFKSGRSIDLQVAKAKAAISQEIVQELNSNSDALKARHELAMILRLSSADEQTMTFDGFPSLDSYPLLCSKAQQLNTYLSQNLFSPSPKKPILFKEGELEEWKLRDPLIVARPRLAELHGVEAAELDAVDEEIAALLAQMRAEGLAAPMPDPELLAAASEFKP
jgi:outer membrane protein TolC